MLKLVLIFLAGFLVGGSVGMIAMSLLVASKVEPPPLDKKSKRE